MVSAPMAEVAHPATSGASYVGLRASGQAVYGVYDPGAGACLSGGGAASMVRTARGWMLRLYGRAGINGGSITLSIVGNYELASETNAEVLAGAALFRAFKTQGYSTVSTQIGTGDWSPSGNQPAASSPVLRLLSAALARSTAWTVLPPMLSNPSPQKSLGQRISVGSISARWGSSDSRLIVLNRSMVIGYIDHPITPDAHFHVMARYDGATLTLGVATGVITEATEFKSVSVAIALAAAADISFSTSTPSAAVNGTVPKIIVWHAVKSTGDLVAFMRSLTYGNEQDHPAETRANTVVNAAEERGSIRLHTPTMEPDWCSSCRGRWLIHWHPPGDNGHHPCPTCRPDEYNAQQARLRIFPSGSLCAFVRKLARANSRRPEIAEITITITITIIAAPLIEIKAGAAGARIIMPSARR